MSKAEELDLLDYYVRELDYLRKDGKDFAQRFPKVASRLDLRESESLDPHTERLIESVAFLAARVHRDIDREYSEVASCLLENLCPSLIQPIPSSTVVKINPSDQQGKITAGIKVPKHTTLTTKTTMGDDCKFRTIWNSKITSLEVVEAKVDDGNYEVIGSAATISSANTTQAIVLTANNVEGLTNFAEQAVLTFRSVITDTAGNSTTGTASLTTLTVDETDPTVTEVTAVTTPGNDTTPTVVLGSSEVGSISSTLDIDLTSVQANNSNSATFDALSDGSYTPTVTVTDSAGNATSLQLTTFVIDTAAP